MSWQLPEEPSLHRIYGGTQMQILAQQWMSPVALTFETVDSVLRETEIYTNAQCNPI